MQGDVIKFGRVRFKVKELRSHGENVMNSQPTLNESYEKSVKNFIKTTGMEE